MTPVNFPRANHIYGIAPDGWKASVCGADLPLPVAIEGEEHITVWQLDDIERAKLMAGGFVTMKTHGGVPIARLGVATAKDLELQSPAAG